MPTEAPPLCVAGTNTAARAAVRNWRGNHRALAARQPAQAALLSDCDAAVTWAAARDGSLSGRTADGRWLAGCSVPLLAGRALLRTLAVEPGGHCLLCPAHAGLVVAARERLGPDPVLFVVQPDLACCRTILGCGDFADELAGGRLWFFAGEGWAAEFRRAFHDHQGLAAPARFVRTRLTADATVEPLIADAQQVIGELATVRTERLQQRLGERPPHLAGRTLIIAGSRFRLWMTPGEPLQAAVAAAGGTPVVYDTDDPLTASPIALADAARGCAAVAAVDIGRGDAAPVVPAGVRWITWLTRPLVPAYTAPEDRLILADPGWHDLARQAGWPAEQVYVGCCPPLCVPNGHPPVPTLGVIADTGPIVLPEAVRDFSSHRLLWEAIEAELHDQPLAMADAASYLTACAARMNLDPDQLDADTFVGRLILPAYEQGLARVLIRAGLPIRLWGRGWDELPDFLQHAAAPITGEKSLHAALHASTALVRHAPGQHWHPVEACGRPTLSPAGPSVSAWLSKAAALLRSPRATTAAPKFDLMPLVDAFSAALAGAPQWVSHA